MTANETNANNCSLSRPKTGRRSLIVRQAAARAAVTASKKTGRPVDERVQKIANSRDPEGVHSQ